VPEFQIEEATEAHRRAFAVVVEHLKELAIEEPSAFDDDGVVRDEQRAWRVELMRDLKARFEEQARAKAEVPAAASAAAVAACGRPARLGKGKGYSKADASAAKTCQWSELAQSLGELIASDHRFAVRRAGLSKKQLKALRERACGWQSCFNEAVCATECSWSQTSRAELHAALSELQLCLM
jgi:hypothetical protein